MGLLRNMRDRLLEEDKIDTRYDLAVMIYQASSTKPSLAYLARIGRLDATKLERLCLEILN